MKMHALILSALLIGAPSMAWAVGQAPAGQKMSQAECDSLWMQANPSNSATISQKQSQPFVTDFKRADSDNDGTLSKTEFSKACSSGLVRGTSSSGTGTGESGTAR